MTSGSVIKYFLLAGLFVYLPAQADELENLMRSMAAVKNRVVVYKEEKQMEVLEDSLYSEGRLEFIVPNKLIRCVIKPVKICYTIDSRQLTIEKAGKIQTRSLDNFPLVRVFVESFRAVLAGDLATLKKHYSIIFTGDLVAWEITLRPKDKKLTTYVKKIELSGVGDDIQSYIVEDSNGDLTRMQLYQTDSEAIE
ncbi:MAG: hypothetical protein GXP23_02505 [Gammaproteobacteria bacterium]|nr:hypothetical protein [Gammaproteobacteria bacterium]